MIHQYPPGLSLKTVAFAAFAALAVTGATAAPAPQTLSIWPNAAPGTESWTQVEEWYGDAMDGPVQGLHVRNVTIPGLQVFAASRETASGTAVIIAPGGGFTTEAWEKEGTLMAEWLQQRGVSSFVLKYRLTPQAAGGAGGRGRGGAPALQVPGASASQLSALAAMEQGVTSQLQAVATARTALVQATFSGQPGEVPSKLDALRLAEQGLAAARAEAFTKLQGTDDKLSAELVQALVLTQSGGNRGAAGGRGAGAGGAASGPNVQELAAADGKQAMRYVREHASTWGIDPNKLGFVGFSAGGYISIKAAIEGDAATRPNFVGSVYGCCVGNSVTAPADAPPLFLVSAVNDGISYNVHLGLVQSWKAVNRPVEIHMYSTGGHGFGMAKRNLPHDSWIDRFGDWLRTQKLMK